jgi:hypothetical protein
MSEEKARSDAEALASALGITFYVERNDDGHFSAAQLLTTESEMLAVIEPPTDGRHGSLEKGPGMRTILINLIAAGHIKTYDPIAFGEVDHERKRDKPREHDGN